jgi:REP element-mobilizing transposase RayT
MDEVRERYSRGYQPHFDLEHRSQFLTWRLGDALPVDVLRQLEAEFKDESKLTRRQSLSRAIEQYADKGYGECHLADPRASRIMQEILFEHQSKLFDLHAWVVMPNHVHVLLTPNGCKLRTIANQLKGESARRINELLGRTGRLWQVDYHDRYIRSTEHFIGATHYAEWNPVKAGLISDPKLWHWSSANPDSWKRLLDIKKQREQS